MAAVLLIVLAALKVTLHGASASAAVQITPENYLQFRDSKAVVLLDFYADWCRFSQQLKPIFEKAADELKEQGQEQVVLGLVDCEVHKQFCQDSPFHISKYPTLKLVRHGLVSRKEYRGKRATDALVEFVQKQLVNPVTHLSTYSELPKDIRRAVVGYFKDNTSVEYETFIKVAANMRDECPFYVLIGPERDNTVGYKEDIRTVDVRYDGDVTAFPNLLQWLNKRCIPMVREITFENGEELTEEGLPFLILFYDPEQPEIKETFRQKVEEELMDQRDTINSVTANGLTFAHPLQHLQKTRDDLPLLVIDSFRHMFVFPTLNDMHVPGKLKQFVQDLHSGKLHREFHNGPDQAGDPHGHHVPPQHQQAGGGGGDDVVIEGGASC
ncbi:hypothetical protein EMCRGX_G018649 [Ephydatia muelleri]